MELPYARVALRRPDDDRKQENVKIQEVIKMQEITRTICFLSNYF